MEFASANNTASGLQSGQCGLTDASARGAWRLPTQTEWQGIVKASCYPSPGAPTIPDKAGTGCYATGTQWASGVQSYYYWSSTAFAGTPNAAWSARLHLGDVNGGDGKANVFHVWPVRGGQ
jgi:formylglycine-generating enzyme required for sulfatase activity